MPSLFAVLTPAATSSVVSGLRIAIGKRDRHAPLYPSLNWSYSVSPLKKVEDRYYVKCFVLQVKLIATPPVVYLSTEYAICAEFFLKLLYNIWWKALGEWKEWHKYRQ